MTVNGVRCAAPNHNRGAGRRDWQRPRFPQREERWFSPELNLLIKSVKPKIRGSVHQCYEMTEHQPCSAGSRSV